MQVLCKYDWPGNIRELANVLERAQILANGETITTDDLPDNIVHSPTTVHAPADVAPSQSQQPDVLEQVERRHVMDVLRKHRGNKVQAAKALGVSRRTLYRLIEKHGLSGEREATNADPDHHT
jgi:DNA-binding NtrC family response regulator